mmetsp:Transcript_83444/g.174623  ORF Transcript_83444/g.174623 Transcript_83444/m.174623 type:complete len:333 (+) Transcript_83444:85-1083(+)
MGAKSEKKAAKAPAGTVAAPQNAASPALAGGRVPRWVFLYQLDNNPKWPTLEAKVSRTLIMRQKGRMLPIFLTIQFLLATSYGNSDNLDKSHFEALAGLSTSLVRIGGAIISLLVSAALFFASVFLEPPPDEDGRYAVRATIFGPLLCLPHCVVLAQLVASIFALVAELSLATGDPVTWLLCYSHASVAPLCIASAALAAYFLLCVKDDIRWLKWLDPFARLDTGAVEIEFLLHLIPAVLAFFDILMKDPRLMAACLPNFAKTTAVFGLGVNGYFAMCQSHAVISGCHYYPNLRDMKGTMDWVKLLSVSVGVIAGVSMAVYAILSMHTYLHA